MHRNNSAEMLVGLQILMTVIAFALGDLLLIEDPVLSADLFEGDIAGIDAKVYCCPIFKQKNCI